MFYVTISSHATVLSFEYFYKCSDHKVITRSMFGLTGMNVVKVEKNAPLLESWLSAVETAAPRLRLIEKR